MSRKRSYRFFFHYYRQKDCMSVHFRGACYPVDNVVSMVRIETHRRKTQPRLVMRGWAQGVSVVGGTAYIAG
jgi:hypothetical protein